MDNLIIRVDWHRELVLFRNVEGVYFISQYGKIIHNGLDYDEVSDEFNTLTKTF